MDNELKPGATEPVKMRAAGTLAEFETPEQLVAAAEKVRDAGYSKWDCFTPFPVHGLDDAMGMQITRLPAVVLFMALCGLTIAICFQCWANGYDYPWNISAKPKLSIPAFIPITFELTVLFGAHTAFLATLFFNQLPQFYHPTVRSPRFLRATSDRFFAWIESGDSKYDRAKVEAFMQSLNPMAVETVEEPATSTPYPGWIKPTLLLLACFALIPPLMLLNSRATKSELPRIHIIQDMDFQAKFKEQTSIPKDIFEDGRAARMPAVGVVARGDVRADAAFFTGKVKGQLVKSVPATHPETGEPFISQATMDRGQRQYDIHCSICHGYAGLGDGTVHKRMNGQAGWTPPSNLHDARLDPFPDGHYFDVVTNGVRNMPGYGHKVSPEDRWAIVLYLRALQYSQKAPASAAPPGATIRP